MEDLRGTHQPLAARRCGRCQRQASPPRLAPRRDVPARGGWEHRPRRALADLERTHREHRLRSDCRDALRDQRRLPPRKLVAAGDGRAAPPRPLEHLPHHRGTYTPLAVLLLDAHTATVLLWTVWIGAVVGLLARVLWLGAPRWLYTPLYVILGMAAIGYLPQFARADAGGPVIVWLIAGCGVAYVIGAVVYATKWPNPSPRWFGFHEVFHSLTVIGYTCTFVAVTIATLASR